MRNALAVMLTVMVASVATGQAPAVAPMLTGPHTTPGAVTRTTLYRIKPDMANAFWSDVRANLVPINEEYRKRGLITGYSIFTKATSDKEDDWGVGISVSYANWGALDNLVAQNTDPITLAHYGSAAKRTAAGQARAATRDVVQSLLLRQQTPNPR